MKMTTVKTQSPQFASQDSKFEALISFINCNSTNIGKQTFYNTQDAQVKTMHETHNKALTASRLFYALMLLPISTTDANRKIAVFNLLNNPEIPLQQKKWENALIHQSFSTMQPNRIFDVLNYLVDMKVNNSRTRNLMFDFLDNNKKSLSLWALKYKMPFRRVVRHAHIPSSLHEAIAFVSDQDAEISDALLYSYHLAKTGDTEAIYKLPMTLARGFAAKYKIKEEDFLKRFASEGQMTQKEKRQQQRELAQKGTHIAVDAAKLDLFDLFVYFGAMQENKPLPNNADTLVENAAKRVAKNVPYHFDNSAVIIDTSLSMSGERETKNHPLYRSLAISAVIKELSGKFAEYRTHDTNSLIPNLSAQTDYSNVFLRALKRNHSYIFILGDGYENTPYEGAVDQILNAYKKRIDKKDKTKVVHFNPVFASEAKDVRSLFRNDKYAGIGIRSAQNLVPAMFLAMCKQNKLLALKAYLSELLKLQNSEAKALQPKETQLLLE